MSLIEGAETVVDQCLKIQPEEEVLVLNDGNDQDLIDALLEVLEDNGAEYELLEYEELGNQGEEPPERVAERMREVDVIIAPTLKSLTHTDATGKACEAGARMASMPKISKKIWNSSLQADYGEISRITRKVYELLEVTEKVRIETPSGTDLSFRVDIETYHQSEGMIKKPGKCSNLPDGEPNGYPEGISGTLFLDHFPFSPEARKVEIEDGVVVSIENENEKKSNLEQKFNQMPCSKKIAEFGFGTNPEATLIGNVLQDEKVLGTVHIAFGDNTSYVQEGRKERNPCDLHWDAICKDPTVWFDGEKVLDEGDPIFLEKDFK
ncbi:MAG: aminopeptidase [Candidatus Nanohaloarchaea archaeon]